MTYVIGASYTDFAGSGWFYLGKDDNTVTWGITPRTKEWHSREEAEAECLKQNEKPEITTPWQVLEFKGKTYVPHSN